MTDDGVEGLVTLQERLVNLINQLTIPLVEVSIVIQNIIAPMLETLEEHSQKSGVELPDEIAKTWPIADQISNEIQTSLGIDKILSVVDNDRMDILETLIRVTMIETNMNVLDAISALRMWEHLARTQLSNVTSPGQLFSPFEIPEDW